jgi:hypothetical protein
MSSFGSKAGLARKAQSGFKSKERGLQNLPWAEFGTKAEVRIDLRETRSLTNSGENFLQIPQLSYTRHKIVKSASISQSFGDAALNALAF